MTRLAPDVLDFLLVAVYVAITHGFDTGVAVQTVKCVLAAGEFGNWLIVFVKAVSGLIVPFNKGHLSQIVVSPVVAGVTLCVGDGSGEGMDLTSLRCASKIFGIF